MPTPTFPALRAVCPACTSRHIRQGPSSHKTGAIVATCSTCGCHFLSNPPPNEEAVEIYDFDREEYAEFARIKRQDTLDDAYEVALGQLSRLIQSGGKALFDVGAGAGEFLERARKHGFEPHGNELAPGAIVLANELTGIELVAGDLSAIQGENLYDAVTMWCVLAHVTEPDELLTHILRVLKPGGVLFLQTPRWSAMDTGAFALTRLSRGRMSRVLDRRVNTAHMVLSSESGLRVQAARTGFDVIDVYPLARYSLKTDNYLRSLGIPTRVAKAAAKGFDVAVDRNFFFRNILDLYARKPLN